MMPTFKAYKTDYRSATPIHSIYPGWDTQWTTEQKCSEEGNFGRAKQISNTMLYTLMICYVKQSRIQPTHAYALKAKGGDPVGWLGLIALHCTSLIPANLEISEPQLVAATLASQNARPLARKGSWNDCITWLDVHK